MAIFLGCVGVVYFLLFGLHCHVLKCKEKTMERIVATVYLMGAMAYASLAYAELAPAHGDRDTAIEQGAVEQSEGF